MDVKELNQWWMDDIKEFSEKLLDSCNASGAEIPAQAYQALKILHDTLVNNGVMESKYNF